jgi:hypothetical protein
MAWLLKFAFVQNPELAHASWSDVSFIGLVESLRATLLVADSVCERTARRLRFELAAC